MIAVVYTVNVMEHYCQVVTSVLRVNACKLVVEICSCFHKQFF